MTMSVRIGAALALGWTSLLTLRAEGQALPPGAPGDPGVLAQRMAEQVARLGDDAATDLGATPAGKTLVPDIQELAQAVDEFQASLPTIKDRFAIRRAYSGIDASWHNLQLQLTRPGVASPIVARDTARVSQIDDQFHQALGLNPYPAHFYGGASAPTGTGETKRLAHALSDRAEALRALVRADVGGAGEPGLRAAQAAASLADGVDAFHDGIDLNSRLDVARGGFAGVVALGKELEQDLAAVPATPRIQDAWRAYKSVEVLLRQNLGLPNDPDDLRGTAIPPQGPSPIVALADQLVGQVDAFLQVFGPTARAVPEGRFFLDDAQRLIAAAADFRQDAARGLNPGQLAFEFRDVDACWQRLARRTNRIAKGRSGPNTQQVDKMGQTLAQIHQLLGLSGYPPVVGPFPPPG